ncbi:hypothetical protein, partial [Phocaeicola coprocola]|uniref:hypothetical protein n=1 Tax=Phocaeicola coprocola TaxID=310298 RepID=UPI0039F5FB14
KLTTESCFHLHKILDSVNISDSSLTLKKTLFIIDGKEVEPKALNEINPDQISSINVIKDGTGITIFGPKAREG